MHLLPVVAQVVVPLLLLVWIRRSPGGSRVAAILRIAAAGAYLTAIALAGLWLVVPQFFAFVYLAVLAVHAVFVARQLRSLPSWPRTRTGRMGLAPLAALAAGSIVLIVQAIAGYQPPAFPVVDLEFPLRDATFLVVNGGSNTLVSAHVQTLTGERYRAFRGQSYGVDMVALNDFGFRASGIAPADPRRYVIFGQPIHAPCSGVVLRADDGHPDMAPPRPDRDHIPGNFVFMDCGDVHVLLAHMERGSVRVRPGERIGAGDVVGHVGNSGNTNEPHLHIHAQRPAGSDEFLSGDPLPIRLGGRFLVRNDRVTMNR